MPGTMVRKAQPRRCHLDLSKPTEVRYWARHFGVDGPRLTQAVAKVGNAAAAVRKELGLAAKTP